MQLNKKFSLALSLAAMAASLSFATHASAQNLVTNGDFETGDLTAWTESPGSGDTSVTTPFDGFTPFGNDAAYFGAVGFVDYISQTLATTAGQTYDLNFEFGSDGATPNEFIVTWDGTTLSDQVNIPATGGFVDVDFTGLVASTNSTTLSFGGRNDPAYLALDNVSVTAVPEPATVALFLGAGSLGFVALRRRKARSA